MSPKFELAWNKSRSAIERGEACDKVDRLSCANVKAPIVSLPGKHPGKHPCPVCKEGTLCGQRDMKTFEILDTDICVLCGQRFKYEGK